MHVATWNLWWRFGEWEERQPAIVAELVSVDPDIAFLQEVWAVDGRDQAIELADACGLNVVRTHYLDDERRGLPQEFGNAILSRWPIEVLEQIALSGPSGKPSHRSALAARIAAPGGDIVAVVTHLAWQYDQSELRERQLAEVVDLVRRHSIEDDGEDAADGGAEQTMPIVLLGGDMNAVPESDEIRRLTGLARGYGSGLVFTDVWAAVGDGPGYTWSRENPNSAEALWPRRRLDYVFVAWPRAKPFANPLSARLIGIEAHRGVVGSDHYGVVAELDDRPVPQESS